MCITNKNLGKRYVSSSTVVQSTALVKVGTAKNPNGITEKEFAAIHNTIINNRKMTIGDDNDLKFTVDSRGNIIINDASREKTLVVKRTSLDYNTNEIYDSKKYESLDGFNHSLKKIQGKPELLDKYNTKLHELAETCEKKIIKLQDYCEKLKGHISIDGWLHKPGVLPDLDEKVALPGLDKNDVLPDSQEILNDMIDFLHTNNLSLNSLSFYKIDKFDVTFAGFDAEAIYEVLPVTREVLLNIESFIYTFNNGRILEHFLINHGLGNCPGSLSMHHFIPSINAMLEFSHWI